MPRKQKCICCGKTYDLCIHCPTDVGYTPWRTMHCSVDHFKIFELVRDYVNGKLPKDKILEIRRVMKDSTLRRALYSANSLNLMERMILSAPKTNQVIKY